MKLIICLFRGQKFISLFFFSFWFEIPTFSCFGEKINQLFREKPSFFSPLFGFCPGCEFTVDSEKVLHEFCCAWNCKKFSWISIRSRKSGLPKFYSRVRLRRWSAPLFSVSSQTQTRFSLKSNTHALGTCGLWFPTAVWGFPPKLFGKYIKCLWPSFAESVHDFQRDTFVCSWASSED